MRRLVYAILLVLALACNSVATVYYFDPASGDDSGGDGSYGTPWKTIGKCTTSRSAGDECRGALTAVTTLAGTLTFTNGSTSVGTSVDLTGSVAAGDVISKNSGLEGWWKVASRTSSVITLTSQYYGLSGSGSAVTGYKMTPVALAATATVASGGSAGNLLKISGGWDLATQSQIGLTALSYTTNLINWSTRSYLEISKFVLGTTTNQTLYGTGSNNYIHDLWIFASSSGSGGFAVGTGSDYTTVENVVIAGSNNHAAFINGASGSFSHFYLFSPGTSSNQHGLVFGANSIRDYFNDLRIYNKSGASVLFAADLNNNGGHVFLDCILNGNSRSTTQNVIYQSRSGGGDRWYNYAFSGVSSAGKDVLMQGTLETVYFIGGSMSSTAGDIQVDTASPYSPAAVIYNTGEEAISYYTNGTSTITSTGARSGSAISITPSHAVYPVSQKLGSVKIPSADGDLTLALYIKKSASFNGSVWFEVFRNGKYISITQKTPTESYTQETVIVSSSDLVLNDYLDLYVRVNGTAGNVWFDDFSASQ